MTLTGLSAEVMVIDEAIDMSESDMSDYMSVELDPGDRIAVPDIDPDTNWVTNTQSSVGPIGDDSGFVPTSEWRDVSGIGEIRGHEWTEPIVDQFGRRIRQTQHDIENRVREGWTRWSSEYDDVEISMKSPKVTNWKKRIEALKCGK